MKPITTLTLTALLSLALLPHGTALHCNGNIVALEAGDETFYIDDRGERAGEIDHWFYLEDNGVNGLQSGSPCSFHTCDGPIPGLSTQDYCTHASHDLLIL